MKQHVPKIVAIANLLLCIAYLTQARQYRMIVSGMPGPGAFPWTIGAFWFAMSLWSIVEVWQEGPAAGLATEWTDAAGWLRILVVLLSAAGFILLLDFLGDLIVSFLAIAVVMRTMGAKNPVYLLGTSIAVAAVSHFLFVTQLGVQLPQGILSDLGWM